MWNVRLGAEHSGLEFWLSSIECHAPSCPIFVVGTHIDEVNKYELNTDMLKSRYPQIAGFYYVSNHSGYGIDNLSRAIVEAALNEKYMVRICMQKCSRNFYPVVYVVYRVKKFRFVGLTSKMPCIV